MRGSSGRRSAAGCIATDACRAPPISARRCTPTAGGVRGDRPRRGGHRRSGEPTALRIGRRARCRLACRRGRSGRARRARPAVPPSRQPRRVRRRTRRGFAVVRCAAAGNQRCERRWTSHPFASHRRWHRHLGAADGGRRRRTISTDETLLGVEHDGRSVTVTTSHRRIEPTHVVLGVLAGAAAQRAVRPTVAAAVATRDPRARLRHGHQDCDPVRRAPMARRLCDHRRRHPTGLRTDGRSAGAVRRADVVRRRRRRASARREVGGGSPAG